MAAVVCNVCVVWPWAVAQIRTSASSSECVPTCATTRRVLTSAAATNTSPESMTPARLTVSITTFVSSPRSFQNVVFPPLFFTSVLECNDLFA